MKRRALLCLAGGATAAAAACAGPGAVAPSPAPHGPAARATANPVPSAASATAVATGYYRAVVARDYRLAFGYLATDATGPDGRRLTWSAFLQLADTMDGAEGPVVDFSVGAYGDLVVMTLDRENAGRYHAHLRIARAADRWAIASIDRI